MGEGGGNGSGKWMAATLYFVVPAGPVLDNCGFLRPPWGWGGRGDGSGKWMAASSSSTSGDGGGGSGGSISRTRSRNRSSRFLGCCPPSAGYCAIQSEVRSTGR